MTTPRAVRYRCDLYGRFQLENLTTKVRVLELSEGGAFIEEIEGLQWLEDGDTAQLTLALPGGDPWASVVRIVRFGASRKELKTPGIDHLTVRALGFGLEFIEMQDAELERLRDFLELLDLR